MMATNITLLGTGTSQGVPLIGCHCEVCLSNTQKDKRLRTSALIKHHDLRILIDVGPDFRQQMLRENITHLDAILLTHEHNDHIIGIDDIRPFNFRSGKPMRVYAMKRVAGELMRRFNYIFTEKTPGLPEIELIEIDENSVLLFNDLSIQCFRVEHGRLPILGFRIKSLGYITDMKKIAEEEQRKLNGIKKLIVNALHHTEHPTHMNLIEALDFIDRINVPKSWITHCSHQMGLHDLIDQTLPANVSLGYDGLCINIDDE